VVSSETVGVGKWWCKSSCVNGQGLEFQQEYGTGWAKKSSRNSIKRVGMIVFHYVVITELQWEVVVDER